MTVLIVFDCDQTLDLSGGPIPVSKLYEINTPPYIQVAIVSPSPFCAKLPFPRFVTGNTRLENLLSAALAYPSLINIYVSDNIGDNINSEEAGFSYIHPKDFHFPIGEMF